MRKSKLYLTGVPEKEEREYGTGNNQRENETFPGLIKDINLQVQDDL